MSRLVGVATVVWLLAGAWLVPPLRGQDVAGALRGRVQGPDSQPLAQVEIEASSPSLPQPVTVKSDARGRFQLLSLPVGAYVVRLRAVGYRPVRYQGVEVGLGRTADLGSIVLQTLTVELPEITVEARPAPVDPTTTTVGATIPATAFDALPLDRSFRSVVALVPQATYQPPNLGEDGAGSEGVNIAGGTVWDNAYYVDGMDVTDPLNGTTGANLPYNFLQAVEVKTGGYEAEYGRALGGVINMVTPSGSNRFEGEAFSFLSDHRFTTTARYGRNEPNLDSYTQFDLGLALSGPIRRDRAWFYAAYSPIISDRAAFFRGMTPARDRLTQHRFAGKITWQPGPATRLALSGLGDPGVHDAVQAGDFGTPDSVLNPQPVLGTWRGGGESLSLRGTQLIGSRLLLEAAALRSWFRSDRLPQSPLGDGPVLLDFSSDPNSVIGSGGFGGSDRVQLDRTSLQLRGTLGAGPHTVKAGVEYQLNTLHERLEEGDSTAGGIWRYRDSVYVWDRLVGDGSVANRVYTLFAQDSWEATGWLRLNGGLRWEEQNWLDSRRATRQVIPHEWSPRLGFVITPGSAGVQKIVGSAGRFYEQVPLGALEVFYGRGLWTATFYPQDPRVDTAGSSTFIHLPFGTTQRTPGLRGEYYDEVTLGYERALGGGFRAGIRGTYRVLRSIIEDTQIFGDTDYVGNPGRGLLRGFPAPNHRYRALEFTLERGAPGRVYLLASYVLSRNTGNYNGLWAGDGQSANASSQFDVHDSLVISTGPLPGDRTHVVKLAGSCRLPFGLTLGLFGSLQSGAPISELGLNRGYAVFLRPRGTAGRTPWLWDLNLRLDYELPGVTLRGGASRVILDLQHIGSPRRPVAVDQLHYLGFGPADGTNPHYGQAVVNQPPMSLRLGVVTGF